MADYRYWCSYCDQMVAGQMVLAKAQRNKRDTRWLRCDDYLDRDAEYRGKVGGGCGIYNYPWPGPVIPAQVSQETSRPGPS